MLATNVNHYSQVKVLTRSLLSSSSVVGVILVHVIVVVIIIVVVAVPVKIENALL